MLFSNSTGNVVQRRGWGYDLGKAETKSAEEEKTITGHVYQHDEGLERAKSGKTQWMKTI